MERQASAYGTCKGIIKYLEKNKNAPHVKEVMSNLKRSYNMDSKESIPTLSFIFSFIPEELQGKGQNLNTFEETVLIVCQIYSIYSQGKQESVIYESEDYPYKNFGYSLSKIRATSKNKEGLDKRFNALITSNDINELKHHLRQVTLILKTNGNEKIDFATLGSDIYQFLHLNKSPIRVKWARDYYRYNANTNK